MLGAYSRIERLARTGALTPGTPDYDLAVGPPIRTVTPAVWQAVVASTRRWLLRALAIRVRRVQLDQFRSGRRARQALGELPLGDIR